MGEGQLVSVNVGLPRASRFYSWDTGGVNSLFGRALKRARTMGLVITHYEGLSVARHRVVKQVETAYD